MGSISAGRLQDRFGRRPSLITGTLVTTVAVVACFVANLAPTRDVRRGIFLGTNLVQGAGLAMIACSTQTYVSEVAPVALRSALLTCIPIFTLLGQLLGALVAFLLLGVEGSWSYRAAFAAQWPFSVVVLLIAVLIPESPAFLVRKNSLESARRAQARLRPASVEKDMGQLIETIQNEADNNSGGKIGYRQCFRGTNRHRTLIVMFANFIPTLFGLPLLANSSYFLQIVGLAAGDAFRVLIIGITVGLVANCVAVWTLSIYARRVLIIASLLVSSALWMSVGIAGCFDGSGAAW